MNKNSKTLGTFTLVMMTIVSVDSIRNLPATALFGTSLIAFFSLAAIFFLIPSALVSAELASGWPKQGGIYIWIREAFGPKIGFLAVWLQWTENLIWYPTILSFVAGTLAYLVNPAWGYNKFYLVSVILLTFWGVTLVNLKGIELSARLTIACSVFGLIVPMLAIISLGAFWLTTGHTTSHIPLNAHALIPDWSKDTWVSLTSIILSCTGMEITTVHARDVINPQRTFPKALLYSVIIIISTLICGSLAIAIVLPVQEISLVSGIMQAFEAFFSVYHLSILSPVVAIMLVLGGIGSVNNWVVAPVKGLLVAIKDNHLLKPLAYENQYSAPSRLLLCQALLVSLLSFTFLFMPTVNSSYWLLTALASQLYVIMYILMFSACIYLRYKSPHVKRAFSIPNVMGGAWLWGVMGILASTITLIVGFIPPSTIVSQRSQYFFIISSLLIVTITLPFFMGLLKRNGKSI